MYKILFRVDHSTESEFEECRKIFGQDVYIQRSDIPPNSIVIGRYSVLPFYHELCGDLALNGSKLINTYEQHRYIADLKEWYSDLKEYTPLTWGNITDIPSSENGPFILKGETNSKKFQWKTHMFASDRKDAIRVMCNLNEDGLISQQSIYIRKFEKLFEYDMCKNISGQPVTKEFRFFILNKQVVYSKFYWSNFGDEIEEITGKYPDPDEVPRDFLNTIINRIGNSANFYVIDVGQKENGEWIVIELNDGQMSGLSAIDYIDEQIFYQKLEQIIM